MFIIQNRKICGDSKTAGAPCKGVGKILWRRLQTLDKDHFLQGRNIIAPWRNWMRDRFAINVGYVKVKKLMNPRVLMSSRQTCRVISGGGKNRAAGGKTFAPSTAGSDTTVVTELTDGWWIHRINNTHHNRWLGTGEGTSRIQRLKNPRTLRKNAANAFQF